MSMASEVLEHFGGYPAFSYRDVYLFMKGMYNDAGYAKDLIHALHKKKKIYAIRRGFYTTHKDESVAGYAFRPFYYGLTAALMIRELSGQQTHMEIITPNRIDSTEIVVFNDERFKVFAHHIAKKHFFGFESISYSGFALPVSDPEKTLIDLVYFQKKLPRQEYSELLSSVNTGKLRRYLAYYDRPTKRAVMNLVKLRSSKR